ncbi:MAG: phosphate ABC transporter substrate-binding protein [Spirochaetota bacterium]
MKKAVTVLGLVLIATMAFATGQQEMAGDEGESIRLSMGGSTTVEPIITSAMEVYRDEIDPNAELSYDAPGSSAGIRGLLDGTYGLGAASRSLKDSELEAGVVPTQIATDGLAVIVNGSVPVDNLSMEQIAAIFVGDITNWSELDGPNEEIVVVNRDEASGTRGAFLEIVLEAVYGDDAAFTLDALVTESNGNMATMVAQTPFAIGYASLNVLPRLRETGGKSLSVNGIEDTVENVLSGEYPIARPLNVATVGEPTGDAKAFIDFLLSERGQEIVAEVDYLPVR